MGHSDCIDRIRIVSENLNAEAKERAAGDDESAKLVIAARQALEKEVRERKTSELDMEQKILENAAHGEHERGERERESAAVRGQIAGLRQDLGGEKDERAADIAACKRNLSSLEGHITQQRRTYGRVWNPKCQSELWQMSGRRLCVMTYVELLKLIELHMTSLRKIWTEPSSKIAKRQRWKQRNALIYLRRTTTA